MTRLARTGRSGAHLLFGGGDATRRVFSCRQVRKDRTHFKRPKAGNQRLVVPVGDAGAMEFVIDVNLFELDRVHRAQAAAGQNICMKTV